MIDNFKVLQKYQFLLYFIVFLLIAAFVFRDLLFHLQTNLPDWLDYALVNWVIFQNIEKIISFQFANFFNTNAFYPHPYTLLFADTFIPQSLLTLPTYLLTHQVILSFNITFFLTIILNYISSYVFWKEIFKRPSLAFLGALFISFSPFFHLESSHFQMLSLWPFFFSIYFLFKHLRTNSKLNLVLSGFFLATEFLASVYFAVFLILTILLWLVVNLLFERNYSKVLVSFLIIFSVFILIDGVVIEKYSEMKNFYHIKRDLKEYVTYSAQLSDYLFSTPINSLVHKSAVLNKWNSFDRNIIGGKAAFPGFLLITLSLLGLLKFLKQKGQIQLAINLDKERLFFLLLILIGLLFSLGPRLSFNGNYAYIPTPYTFLIKIIPLLEATRVVARWSFLFYLGIIFFALKFLQNQLNNKHFKYLILITLVILFLEYLPLNITTHTENYVNAQYQTIKDLCYPNKKVLLEIPVTHLAVAQGIGEGVNYISKVELSSTYHGCYLVNGYSGYDMPELFKLQSDIDNLLLTQNTEALIKELKSYQVDIIKINSSYVVAEQKIPTKLFEMQLDHSSLVVRIDQGLYKIK